MKNKFLPIERVLLSALLILLLAAGGKVNAQTYTPASLTSDANKAETVGIIPYSEVFITQEEVMEWNYAITSFRMIDTATVAVLTGASDMILVYSLNQNQIMRKIQLPISARAFEYDNGLFHTIGDRTYLTIDAEGMIRERKDFQQPQLPNEEVFVITDLKVIDGQPIIYECNSNTYSITSEGLQKIDTFYFDQARSCKIHPKYIDENSFVIYNETPSRSGRISVSMESLGLEGKLSCLDYISVDDDFIAINLETTYNQTGGFLKSYLLVLNPNGELINLVEVPINFLSYIHKPFLYWNNAWYYAFSGQDGISIFKIDTNTNSVASPDSYELYDEEIDYSYSEPENGTSSEDTNSDSPTRGNWRTITQTWYNAHEYCILEWTPISANVSDICKNLNGSYITTPIRSYGYTETGIPYKWNGFTDRVSFESLASQGKYTGNKVTSSSCGGDPYSSQSDTYVIGVDCSGFVSRCLELTSHTGTGQIASSSDFTNYGSVVGANSSTFQKGDALNKTGNPGHVRLYTGHTSDLQYINVFESSGYPDWKTHSDSYRPSEFSGYNIMRYNNMKNIILRLNSAITMRQNGSTVTNVTQGEPLTVTYSVKNFGSEVWEGDVYLYIEQSDGDLMSIKSDHTTLVPNDYQSFTFSNNGVISPVGTTKFYVKVKNYNAGGYDRPYDVGDGGYSNPLVFEIEGDPGIPTCSSCPDYDETWNVNSAGVDVWTTKSSSIGSLGCHIYRVQLSSSYTYTFETGCDQGTATFDTRLYLYNSSCTQVVWNDDGCSNHLSKLEYTNTGNTAYFYLKIDGYDESEYGSYTIAAKRVAETSPCSECPDYDENWNVNSVSEGVWTTRSSSIGSGGCRIYRVQLMPSYTYTFETGCDQGTATFDTRLYLYNSSCTQVAWNDDGCSNHLSKFEYTNTGTTAYFYLKIDGYDESEYGSYTIAAKRESSSFVIDVSASPSAGGSVSGAGTYQNGSTCTLIATPATGYSFVRWTKNGSQVSTSSTYSFTVTESASYVAVFSQNSYTISASASPSTGGTVSGAGSYNYGSTCTLTATPATGYSFVRWTKNGSQVSTNASYSFTVTGNASYVAEFSQNSYTISASASPSNGGSVSGSGTYNYGSTCTLTASPASGYSFVRWTKNGSQVSTNATYSFTVTASASYVAVFEQSTTTQSQTLSSGWNWWSSYIELSGVDGLTMLENSLGSCGLTIKSRLDGYVDWYQYNGSSGWFGSLNSICNEQMYKINVSANCTVAITGIVANPSNHPITISNGWNWIGFPLNQSVGVDVALSGFSPAMDDVIKGRNSYTTYYSSNGSSGWFGSLNTLEPGCGYMYQSQSSGTKTLVYQTSRGEATVANITPEDNVYQPSDQRFADNMTVTAVVEMEGEELRSDSHELSTFVDGECRGSIRLMYVEPIDRYVAFLTVFGDQGDVLEFRLTDGTETQVSTDALIFASDGMVGTLASPKVLHFGTLGVSETSAMVRIYPNPIRRRETLNIALPEASERMTVEIGNVLGMTVFRSEIVMEPTSVARIILPDTILPGTYVLKAIRTDGTVYYGKLIVQ